MDEKRKFDIIVSEPCGAAVLRSVTADDFQRVIQAFYDTAKDGASQARINIGGGYIAIYERGVK